MLNETDLSRIDLNLLVLFEAVMEERHVGRTAARMNLSPSGVSHGLTRLRRLFDDPLFLRTPRGVVPTDRAEALRMPVAEALMKLREILLAPEEFDPTSSHRQFTIGAPDGISAVVLPQLLTSLSEAPHIRISCRELLPDPGEPLPDRAWRSSFDALDSRTVDLAILPIASIPGRFATEPLYGEDFVIAMRSTHRLASKLSLDHYCRAEHLLVSQNGDAEGFVDAILASRHYRRTVTATVPNSMLALALLSVSDLISALPRQLVKLHGPRFDVIAVEPPIELGSFGLKIVLPLNARMDKGLAWFLDILKQAVVNTERLSTSARPVE